MKLAPDRAIVGVTRDGKLVHLHMDKKQLFLHRHILKRRLCPGPTRLYHTKQALSYFAALYHAAPRSASCPIHTNRRRRTALRHGLSYFAAGYCAALYCAAFLLLDFALLKNICIGLVET
uniref:Uncharacterized protein n=1 Tax=Romanomermis culicivorax TaxID=13658 RepID=A0A915HPC2_ROMCU